MKILIIIITLLALIVSTDTFILPTSNNQLIRTDVTTLSSTVVNEYSLMTTLPRHPNNNDANDIANKIKCLFHDEDLYASLVFNGKERLKYFDNSREQAEKYLKICREISLK